MRDSLFHQIDPAAWFTLAVCGITLLIMGIDQIRWKRSMRAWRREAKEQHQAALDQIANAKRERSGN
jgi:hypothetical protein